MRLLAVVVAINACAAPAPIPSPPPPPDARRDEGDERRQAERERALVAARAVDKPDERIGLSAVVCAFSYLRRHAGEEIATERKYAAEGGGIVDMRKLHDLQNQMRLADESLARLGERAADPLPCEGEVLEVANCVLAARLTGEIPGAPACNSKTSLWAYEQ